MTSHVIPQPASQDEEPPAIRYRAVNRLAITSLVFAGLSILTPLHWLTGILPLVGVALAWLALKQIQELPNEYTGRLIAHLGLWLSVALWIVGYGWLTYRAVQRVPFGYDPISYEELQPGPGQRVPALAIDMQDKKVYVEGFMYPTRQQSRLKGFILCPMIRDCPWCNPSPQPTELINVELTGEMETDFTRDMRGVGGILHVDPTKRNPYRLEADYLR